MRDPSSLVLGLADSVDPTNVLAGSGASTSLLEVLDEVAARAVPISGELPRPLARVAQLSSVATRLRPRDLGDLRAAAKRAHYPAMLGRTTTRARSWLMRGRLAAAGHLDAVVQRSSDMRLPASCRVVTLEDSTVLQAWHAYPWAHLQGLSERDVQRYAGRQRQIYQSAVACCCATHWVAEDIVASYGIPRERVFTVGLGSNHEVAEPAGKDWSRPRYLFIGVDWRRKNGDAVLAAFARVREVHPDASLEIAGGHPRVDQPGVVPHGRLSLARRADRERIAQLYREATVFVMPSLHEPAGIVYVEAGGAGVPSIGTTNGGASTMIGPGGLVVDPRSPEQIVEAMLTLAHPDTARGMGRLAREHAALLTPRKVAERLVRATGIPGLDTSGLADFL
jgi:glycosyltransferase involved in cell wall biosynthesis